MEISSGTCDTRFRRVFTQTTQRRKGKGTSIVFFLDMMKGLTISCATKFVLGWSFIVGRLTYSGLEEEVITTDLNTWMAGHAEKLMQIGRHIGPVKKPS